MTLPQALDARLHDADPVVRSLALRELADAEDEAHLPRLCAALHDPAPAVRLEAARGLAAWEQAETVQALIGALDNAEPAVREAAARSLGELQDPASAAWLRPALAHPQAAVRAQLLQALRPLRCAAALPTARSLLDDAEPAVRAAAVELIAWLKPPEDLPRLAQLAGDDAAPAVRRAALAALAFAPADAPGVDAVLARSLREEADWSLREAAAATLVRLRWPALRPALQAALEDSHWQVRLLAARALGRLGRAAAPALPALIAQLDRPVPNLRKEVVIALGEVGDPAARPALLGVADDLNPDVRKLARLALTALDAK